MFKKTLLVCTMLGTSAVASDVQITGNVQSKCTIVTETEGVYGNPAASVLTTSPSGGGVEPIVRYDVILADAYKAKISYPTSFSSSPTLNDTLNWIGEVSISQVSDAAMSAYETNKVVYDNATEFDLTEVGSTWFKVESEVSYGVGKSLPGGTYTAIALAECIAK